jgi:ABC-2 type transport system ATP-binding protein
LPILPEGSIGAQRIWKRFRSDRRRALLAEELGRFKARFRGGQDQYWRWALRDVTLTVEPGEAVALVGANGSGKSTLLKILTGVMFPHAGRLDVIGRVGALIEVSAGIHPELTGRENAYLYGSLLGHPRKKVMARMDEIVNFAELDTAIDRQVKFYSSGMKMRLGFAVAALLEPDILLVDEVLAVGDATFQQKCLDRMRAVMADGTTLVFVSHDLAAVEATCTRGLWLRDGIVAAEGPINGVLSAYRQSVEEAAEAVPHSSGPVQMRKVALVPVGGTMVRTGGALKVELVLDSDQGRSGWLFIGVSAGPSSPIFSVQREILFTDGEIAISCTLRDLPLPRGRFYVWVGVFGRRAMDLVPWHPAGHFDVVGPELEPAPRAVARLSPVFVNANWELESR